MDDGLDILGPALLSLTGCRDRLRMHCLLAYVNCKPTKTGISFTWEGAWEFDQMLGSGSVILGKNGRLKGIFRIKDVDAAHVSASQDESSSSGVDDGFSFKRTASNASVLG
jgi:hypothetical protein